MMLYCNMIVILSYILCASSLFNSLLTSLLNSLLTSIFSILANIYLQISHKINRIIEKNHIDVKNV